MWERWQRTLHRIEDGILAGALLLLVFLSVAQILMRTVLDSGWIHSEPLSRLLVLWIAMLGALAATRQHKHIAIDALPRLLPASWRRGVWALTQAFAAIVCAGMAWFCWQLLQLERAESTPLWTVVPAWVGMTILPVGFGLMALRFSITLLSPPPRIDTDGMG